MLNVNNTLIAGGFYKGGAEWNKRATNLDHCFKLYYVVKGEALITSNNEEHKIEAGGLYFINGFSIKKQCCPEYFEVNWLHFMCNSILIKQFLGKLPGVFNLSKNISADHKETLKSLSYFFDNSDLKENSTSEYFSIYLKVQSMLLHLTSSLISESGLNTFEPENTEIRLMPAIEYMDSFYKNKLTLKKLASLCFLSENYFHNLFKQTFGTTPYNYILRLKMNEAIRLLTNSNLSIKQITQETGFYDVAYFSRVFSKYNGISPRKYRNVGTNRIP